jgi:hypothetical protein
VGCVERGRVAGPAATSAAGEPLVGVIDREPTEVGGGPVADPFGAGAGIGGSAETARVSSADPSRLASHVAFNEASSAAGYARPVPSWRCSGDEAGRSIVVRCTAVPSTPPHVVSDGTFAVDAVTRGMNTISPVVSPRNMSGNLVRYA